MYCPQLIRVTGIEGAKAYRMPPNSIVPLFDGAEDVFYLKSTDGGGFPTIRVFDFTPREELPQAQEQEIMASINELREMILDVKQHIQRSEQSESIQSTNQ